MNKLGDLFSGWDGYQVSLLHAVAPLTPEQLGWRPAPHVRSLGELIRHLALGRITWLSRIAAPGIEDAVRQVSEWYTDSDNSRHVVEDSVPTDRAELLIHWLELSWTPIQKLLDTWTIEHLSQTYIHCFRGTQYNVSRQWTLWRIMSHDIHHGGQIAMMLACQNIPAPELRSLGGHITPPPLAHHEP